MYRKITSHVGFSTMCGFGHPVGILEGIPHGWRGGGATISLLLRKRIQTDFSWGRSAGVDKARRQCLLPLAEGGGAGRQAGASAGSTYSQPHTARTHRVWGAQQQPAEGLTRTGCRLSTYFLVNRSQGSWGPRTNDKQGGLDGARWKARAGYSVWQRKTLEEKGGPGKAVQKQQILPSLTSPCL